MLRLFDEIGEVEIRWLTGFGSESRNPIQLRIAGLRDVQKMGTWKSVDENREVIFLFSSLYPSLQLITTPTTKK